MKLKEALDTIATYCNENNCEWCQFRKSDWCVLQLETPEDWKDIEVKEES